MEKQNQFQSLMALLPNGKVENDVRITETTVTGICTVYLDRADDAISPLPSGSRWTRRMGRL